VVLICGYDTVLVKAQGDLHELADPAYMLAMTRRTRLESDAAGPRRSCISVGTSVQEKGGVLFELANMCTIHNIIKYILPVDGATEEGGSTFSGLGDPPKRGPASNSVVMGGYQCQEPRNGSSYESQIDWKGIREDKMQLWSEVLETLIQEKGIASKHAKPSQRECL